MVAGALITQCLVDENEIGRRSELGDLPGGSHADEEPASGREQLLRDQNGKRRADRTADQAHFDAACGEAVELGVIAGPAGIQTCASILCEVPDDVAIGVENAYPRNAHCPDPLLAPGLPQ